MIEDANSTSALLQPLLDLLGGESGKLAQIVAWVGTLRLALKPLSGQVAGFVQRALDRVLATEDTKDDDIANRVLASWPYRVGAFFLDMLASVKLPLKLTVPEPPIKPLP